MKALLVWLTAIFVLGCSGSPESTSEATEAVVSYTFATHAVFDTGSTLSPDEQRGADPFVRVAPDGNVYVGAMSLIEDPFLSNGGSLWRSSDSGATWSYLGNAGFVDHLGAETAIHVDDAARLWMAELHIGADLSPIYRYDSPASLPSRASGASAVGYSPPAGERPWISSYGRRIHVQYGEALVEPGVRISLDGSQNPPVFTTTIPIAQNPLLRAEVAAGTDGGTSVLGIAQGPLAVNAATGHMCAPLLAVNGSTADYMPAHSLWTACSDDGLVWTNTLVYKNLAVSLMNFWPASAVDAAGNLYFVVAANMDAAGLVTSAMNLFLFSSTDGGLTWSAPKQVNGSSGTHLFPTAAGGCAGGVEVVWYGSSTAGNPSTLPASADFRVYMAQSKSATSASPTWHETDVAGSVVHHGPVNHKGSFGSGVDYRILTIPGLTLDADSRAHVVWADTTSAWAPNPNAFPTAVDMGHPSWGPLYHSRQTSGPELDTCP